VLLDRRIKIFGERLALQIKYKSDSKLVLASRGYQQFLELGGKLRYQDLSRSLIRNLLKKSLPILTGLSATYLYTTAREFGPKDDPDDVRGYPAGHFVVLSGYNKEDRTVLISDPLMPNPVSRSSTYWVGIDRLICSVLLGVLTYDANLLVIQPRK